MFVCVCRLVLLCIHIVRSCFGIIILLIYFTMNCIVFDYHCIIIVWWSCSYRTENISYWEQRLAPHTWHALVLFCIHIVLSILLVYPYCTVYFTTVVLSILLLIFIIIIIMMILVRILRREANCAHMTRSHTQVKLEASALEIYNEVIRDLLGDDDKKKLDVAMVCVRSVFVRCSCVRPCVRVYSWYDMRV